MQKQKQLHRQCRLLLKRRKKSSELQSLQLLQRPQQYRRLQLP